MVSGGWGWDVFPNSLNNHQHSGSDTTRTTFQSGKDMDIVTLCGSSTTGSKISMNGLLHMTSSMWAHWHWKNWKSHAQSWAWGFQRVSERSRSKVQDSFKEVGPKMSTYGSKQVKSYSSTHKQNPNRTPKDNHFATAAVIPPMWNRVARNGILSLSGPYHGAISQKLVYTSVTMDISTRYLKYLTDMSWYIYIYHDIPTISPILILDVTNLKQAIPERFHHLSPCGVHPLDSFDAMENN